jgi:3'-phosphoadenosine 5'-phosphosulfate (PAPS) 3'-phosphatase
MAMVFPDTRLGMTPEIRLGELLSTCASAALLGCNEIRYVQAKRVAAVEEGNSALGVSMKDAADPRSALTEADLAAQDAIVQSLRATWPGIHIIGEEDEPSSSLSNDRACSPTSLRRDLCVGATGGEVAVPLSAVTIFVDPLDGTREFVEGRLDAVQSLIGVSVEGRAVAGAIGVPFPSESSKEAAVIYALTEGGSGVIGKRDADLPPAGEKGRNALVAHPVVVTGDSSNALLAAAREHALAGGGSGVIAGGVGNKLLAVAEGRADLAIMHFGTSLWDTCAPEARLRAEGGRVTDLFGSPLAHLPSPPFGDLRNGLGVVASARGWADAHDALCRAMRANPMALELLEQYTHSGGSASRSASRSSPSGAAAVDIARCLDGGPLRHGWLDALLDGGSGRLRSYAAPEGGAFRGMMSDGCRLVLDWDWESDSGPRQAVGRPPLPSTVFYKRVVMGDLEATREKARAAPKKLARDVESYRVEAAFLGSRACAKLAGAGVWVPRAYNVALRPVPESPLDSKFAMLLSDFSPADGWRQQGLLGEAQLRASLATLARFHAFFWEGSAVWEDADVASELRASCWPSGDYRQPSMQTSEQFERLGDKYRQHYESFGSAFAGHPALASVDLPNLGDRLQRIARTVASAAHPFDGGPAAAARASADQPTTTAAKDLGRFRTLIHGDPKAANLFLRDSARAAAGGCEVGVIDYQWTGFGLAATDVAAHISGAAAPECLSTDGTLEDALLDHYHSVLCSALAEFGAATSAADAAARLLSRTDLQAQYENGLLDTCRIVFSYQWSRASFGKPSLNKNAYNKELRSAVWLTARCNALLTGRMTS